MLSEILTALLNKHGDDYVNEDNDNARHYDDHWHIYDGKNLSL
jgi:hypothetical protein